MQKISEDEFRRLYGVYGGLCLVLAVLGGVFFCNADVTVITGWSVDLLDCMKNGTVRDYAYIMAAKESVNNYPLLTTVIVTAWMSPLYLGSKLLGFALPGYVRNAWFKLFVMFITVASLKVLKDIFDIKTHDAKDKVTGIVLYILLPVIIFAMIAGGQVDGIGSLFLLLAYRDMLKESYNRFAIWGTLSVCIKGISVMIYVPWLILLWKKGRESIVLKSAAITACGILGQRILANLLFRDYTRIVHEFDMNNNFMNNLLDFNTVDTNVFLVIVIGACLVAFHLAQKEEVEEYHFVLIPMIIQCGFIMFVIWNPQYLIYMGLLFILMGLEMHFSIEYLICQFLFAFGYFVSVPVIEGKYYNSSGMLDNALLPILTGKSYGEPFLEMYITKITPYAGYFGRTMMSAAVIFLSWFYWRYVTKEDIVKEENAYIRALLFAVLPIPAVIFIAGSFILYAKYAI